jgi:prepilin-type N-terminal cleavage/methylation domain-containing protein
VAIGQPKYNSQGFTLVETLASLIVIGFIMGMAAPSLLSLNKPLRDGSLQFQAHLNLIRSKAISSNRAYRLRPKFLTSAEYKGQNYQQTAHNFIVESARNCDVDTLGSNPADTTGRSDGWQPASQLDLDLPDAIGVAATPAPQVGIPAATPGTLFTIKPAATGTATTATAESHLNWWICYDNRGVASQPVSLTLKDFQANNRATSAFVDVVGVGSVEIRTKDKNGGYLNASGDNPVF